MGTPLWTIGIVSLLSILSGLAPIYIKKGTKNLSLKPLLLIKNYPLILGCFLYGGTILAFIYMLKHGELSVLYPIASSSYIWVCVFSVKMLKEQMNTRKWAGIASIITGVLCITLSTI